MKIYYPTHLKYICQFKNFYYLTSFDENTLDQRWLNKIDEMFYKKVSVKIYSIFYNKCYIKYYSPFGVESQLFENLLEDCYELANSVNDEEMIQEKLKYFYQNLYKL